MEIKNIESVVSFITKDGSEIRELLAYRNSSIKNQSLAEARVPIGGSTLEHYHIKSEEIYFILEGKGKIKIEDETAIVTKGDAIAILPNKRHKIWNIGDNVLKILCCCAPAYEHNDTVITETR
ncbi:MAG: cupin domain-containing protein [Limisphaerales bacterium]|jgi:mannose-6-phosphate isomerase-like protein (cupin superfamily)